PCGDYVFEESGGGYFFYNGTNNCTDCFTITKTVDNTLIAVGDTITYTITVTSNNGSGQSVIIIDSIPPNFVITSGNVTNNIYLAAQDTQIIIIQGYFTAVGDCEATTNVASMQYGNMQLLYDSACVEVMYACWQPNIIEIADGTQTNLPITYINDTIMIMGVVNAYDTLTFINCFVIVQPGGNIVMHNNARLNLINTTIEGCDTMWAGIYLEENAIINMHNSRLYDAENGVWARKSNGVFIESSVIFNCITGVRMQEPNMVNKLNYNNCYGFIVGTEIAQINKLKPSFAGQSFIDTVMYACIYLQNVKYDIGDLMHLPNELHHAANGVIAHNAITRIRNTEAYYIRPLSMNGNKRSAAYGAISDTGAAVSNMTVLPLTNTLTATAHDSWRGVYSSASNLAVIGNIINNVAIGVSINNNNKLQKATVFGNIISAGSRGVSCNSHAGGSGVNVENNVINIIGSINGKGININEVVANVNANYTVTANKVTINNASDAIFLNNAYKAIVRYNNVRVNGNNGILSRGISASNSNSTTISCNNINGTNASDTLQVGLSTSWSTSNTYICNTVDSVGWCLFFEGTCGGTYMQGNELYKAYEGIRLSSTAIIDTQAHRGNNFVGPFGSGFGAVNMNWQNIFNMQASLFVVDSADGSFLSPLTPSFNSGWFILQGGNTLFCNQTQTCTIVRGDEEFSDIVMERLIQDSVVSNEFEEETQQTADEQAFRNLITDSLRYINDSERSQFVEGNRNEAIGIISEIEDLIALYYKINENTLLELDANENSIDSIVNIISIEDSMLNLINRQTNIDNLNSQMTLREQIFNSWFASREQLLYDAISINDAINERGMPDNNRQNINPIILNWLLNNEYELSQTETEQQYVANQCPHSGGVAVYFARALLDAELDTNIYDDRFVCGVEGYFRKGKVDTIIIRGNLKITPNPTKNYVAIYFDDSKNLNGSILIYDNQNRLSIRQEVKALAIYSLNVSQLSNGYYKVNYKSTDGHDYFEKLIILK
ncbi:MAG: DUF11 domain-containing protein, partial [Bacteroidetes bacterium]|nr:DUF11 domain-containing protein [Bacteroidota bacterium]